MSMYDKNHYNILISLQLIKINGKKNQGGGAPEKSPSLGHGSKLGGTQQFNTKLCFELGLNHQPAAALNKCPYLKK